MPSPGRDSKSVLYLESREEDVLATRRRHGSARPVAGALVSNRRRDFYTSTDNQDERYL